MNTKQLLTLSAAAVFFTNYSEVANANDEGKPNILFIFSDDQKWNTIHELGNDEIYTPALDRLAKRSFIFNNAYCFGGNVAAVCIPARNMVMSGKQFFRFEEDIRQCEAKGVKPNHASKYTNPDWPTFPKSMKAGGYETYFHEKSGSVNNPVVSTQFDHFKDAHMLTALKSGTPAKEMVNDAIDFLSNKRDTSKPFFMYLGLPCPHDPRYATKEFRDLYKPEELTIPVNYKPYQPYNITNMTVRDERLEVWPREKTAIQRHLHDYYSIISSMDYDLGRLLDALDKLDLTKKTIIIFSSDQGLAIGSHGMMGKQTIYEDVMKVPFMLSGPGIEKGSSDALVYTHDIFPTACEMGKIPIPEGLDGKTLLPLITGKDDIIRDALMLAYSKYQRSVRNNKWKIIRFPQIDRTELYDLETDPHEIKNLAESPEYKEILDEMMNLLKKEQKAQGDIIPLTAAKLMDPIFKHPGKTMLFKRAAGGLAPGLMED